MKKSSLKINLFLFIFLIISIIVLTNDYITYFFKVPYLIGLIISSFFVIIINILLVKKKIIGIHNNFSKYDIIFFIILLMLFLTMFVYPDRTFDTLNYHLYLQEHPFGDKIYGDFFASKNINSFTYAFTDRFAYLFRYFLGYRLGILFNYFTIITIYYIIKKIIKNIIEEKKEIFIVIITILCTLTLSSVELLDSYYIDNISVVFLLELFYLTFFEKYNKKILMYIALLAGFSFVSKISNAFIIIVLAIQYIIKHFSEMKKSKIRDYIPAVIIFIIPFFIYLLYTYISTGNPVFPFYNSIFKSKYYYKNNWMDKRFGPKNIIEVLIWPILMQIHPTRSYDIGIVELMWAIGYIVCIINVIRYIYKKIKKKELQTFDYINIFSFVLYLVWSKFMLGYTRYGLMVLYLGLICTYASLYYLIKNKKRIFSGLLIISLLFNIGLEIYCFTSKAQSWSFNNIFSTDYKIRYDGYKVNLKKLFIDRNINVNFGDDSVIGILFNNSGFATMINNTNPIVSLNGGTSTKYTNELLEKRIKNKKIYSITDSTDIENFFKSLNKKKYKIKNCYGVYEPDFISAGNKLYVFEIEKAKKNSNNYFEITKNYKLDDITSGKYNIKYLVGEGKNMRQLDLSKYYVRLSKCKDNKCKDINSYKLKDSNIVSIDETVEVFDGEDVIIRLTDEKNNSINYFAAMIINLDTKKVE